MTAEHELLQFFTHEHLPPALARVSRPFCELAHAIVQTPPYAFASEAPRLIAAVATTWNEQPYDNSQWMWAATKLNQARQASEPCFWPTEGLPASYARRLDRVLRLLLEGKDAAVRAVLFKPIEVRS